MIIGVPKEIKAQESRVSVTPAAVDQLFHAGHTIYIEAGAGIASGFSDEEYKTAGAEILPTAAEVWTKSDLIYKVKEPLPSEYQYLREGLIIYTYLHLAANPELTKVLVDKKVVGIAFETVQIGRSLPLLKPMSEVAGRMAIQEGTRFLMETNGGKGILVSGVPGVAPAQVVIIGAGVVGTAATRVAVGMGARVIVLDASLNRLGEMVDIFGNGIETLYSNNFNIAQAVQDADLVVSTVLIPGHKAPKLITEQMVKTMQKGSVIVDVSIDQGGSTELTENNPTTHSNPVFEKHGVIHYAVANIPGAVPKTSTTALSNATTSYALQIANKGWQQAFKELPELIPAICTVDGYVTNEPVAQDLGYIYKPLDELL